MSKIFFPLLEWSKTKIDATVLCPNYRRLFGSQHPGIDANGMVRLPGRIEGPDRDLGWAIAAIADGKIVHAQQHKVWGWVILLEFKTPDGRTWWAQYAHMKDVYVKVGDLVKGGQVICTVGKAANNSQPAHLHFEIRRKGPLVVKADAWPSFGRNDADAIAYIKENYVTDIAGWFAFFKAECAPGSAA